MTSTRAGIYSRYTLAVYASDAGDGHQRAVEFDGPLEPGAIIALAVLNERVVTVLGDGAPLEFVAAK